MLQLIALLGGFLVAAVVGFPLAGRFARPHGWRGALPDESSKPKTQWHSVGFEPLDFGPDIMHWPSEDPWQLTARPEPPWPSQTWNDTHFGQHWNRDNGGGEHVTMAPEVKAPRRPDQHQALQHEAEHTKKRQMREAVHRATGQAREQAHRLAAEAGQAAVNAAEQRVEQATGVSVNELPTAAELERLVGEVGLAGTVQIIMQRTQWDFRTAAQYLAKARRR